MHEATRATDKRARFEETAVPFMNAVHNVALRLTRSAEDAADLVQETFLRAYRTFDSFTPGTNCRAWLFTILYSIFINRYHRARLEPRVLPIDELERRYDAYVTDGGGHDQARQALRGSAQESMGPEVKRALDDLPTVFRSAVLLVDVEDLSYEEAAAALKCPVGTLRSRLFRGRRLLFAALYGYARQHGYVEVDLRGTESRGA